MSSLARRGLRATATVVGIAAIGVGLAGHAIATPEEPAAEADTVETPPASEPSEADSSDAETSEAESGNTEAGNAETSDAEDGSTEAGSEDGAAEAEEAGEAAETGSTPLDALLSGIPIPTPAAAPELPEAFAFEMPELETAQTRTAELPAAPGMDSLMQGDLDSVGQDNEFGNDGELPSGNTPEFSFNGEDVDLTVPPG